MLYSLQYTRHLFLSLFPEESYVGTRIKKLPSTLPPSLAQKSRSSVFANKYYVKSFNAQISTTY